MEQPHGYKPVIVVDSEKQVPIMHMQAPMIAHQPCSHHAHHHTSPKRDDAGFPLSLTTITQVTSFMMGAILLTCGYIKCTDGTFTCDNNSFPDISHVMGKAPLNKLYAIMLTVYAAVKMS